MKKIIRLTERDLARIVKRVIIEEKTFNPNKNLGMIKTALKNNKFELAISLGEIISNDVDGMSEVVTHLKKILSEIDKVKNKLNKIEVSK